MNKSDLRSGMLVTLRNGYTYYVMLNTGLPFDQANLLIRNVGNEHGWMPLPYYAEDMTCLGDPEDLLPSTPEENRKWDIMQVASTNSASHICQRQHYNTIWIREE